MSAAQFLEAAVSVSAQAALAVLLAHALASGARSGRARDRIWAAAHLSLLALAAAAFALPHPRLFALAGSHAPALVSVAAAEALLGTTVFWVWVAGTCVAVCRLGSDWWRAARLLRTSVPVLPGQIPAVEADGGTRTPDVRSSYVARGPFCWQIGRPVIVLPTPVLSFPADEFRLILAHEYAHVRAGHPLHLFLQRVAGIIFWFHPAVHWSLRQAERHREFACDDDAVDSRDAATSYVRGLIRLAESRLTARPPLPAGLAMAGGGRTLLAERAERLVERGLGGGAPPSDAGFRRACLAAGACLLGLLWLPVDAGASPRSWWSPWPGWSAGALHDLGIPVRDYELDGHRVRPDELREEFAGH